MFLVTRSWIDDFSSHWTSSVVDSKAEKNCVKWKCVWFHRSVHATEHAIFDRKKCKNNLKTAHCGCFDRSSSVFAVLVVIAIVWDVRRLRQVVMSEVGLRAIKNQGHRDEDIISTGEKSDLSSIPQKNFAFSNLSDIYSGCCFIYCTSISYNSLAQNSKYQACERNSHRSIYFWMQ